LVGIDLNDSDRHLLENYLDPSAPPIPYGQGANPFDERRSAVTNGRILLRAPKKSECIRSE
jgi:hypothetical protein